MPAIVTRKRVVIATVVVAVGVAIAFALRPDAIEVEAAMVREGPLVVTVNAEGRTRVRDRYTIASPVTGRLERLLIREGAAIHAGEVVARIAPTPVDEPTARQARARLGAATAAVAEAATRVRVAQSARLQAMRDRDRAARLSEAGALSARTLEEAELLVRTRDEDLTAARAHARLAAAEVDQARAAALYGGTGGGSAVSALVRAPAAGRVLRLVDRSERVVAPGTPIAEVGDTRTMEVVVDLLSTDAARVAAGMPVLIDGWGGDSVVTGCVRLVEPSATTRLSALGVEEQRVNVLVDVPQPPDALGDGYRVDARIVVWEGASVLTVPTSALVRSGDGWAAYVVREGRARLARVRAGRMSDEGAHVVSGLARGDAVIVFPSDQVGDGVRVTIRKEAR